MAAFVAIVGPAGPPPDAALDRRLADGLAFLGTPWNAQSLDGALRVAGVGRGTGFRSQGAVSIAASGRLDDRRALEAALGLAPGLEIADVLIAAHARWGESLLDHIIGDFAFALWDSGSRTLLAATDQFACRPIYYAQVGERLLVGTAIAPLRDSGLVDARLDDAFVADYLTVGFSLDDTATVHRGIRRLVPASLLAWSGGAPRTRRYWRVPRGQAPLQLSTRAEYVEQFRELFFAAVGDRLPASGPVSLHLSGGMDSTSIAAAARELIGPEAAAARMQAHTIVYRDYPEEEGVYAAQVVERLGIPWKTWVAEDFILRPPLDRSPRAGPQPGASREYSPEYEIVVEAAASGATHLAGLGGDVLLEPPRLFPLVAVRSGAWSPGPVAHHLRLFSRLPQGGWRNTARHLLRRARPPTPQPWLSIDLVRRTRLEARLAEFAAEAERGPAAMQQPFWSQLMSKGDPGNTGLDLPIARPFMDVRLASYAARLPEPLLHGKRILREAMRPYLPPAIVARPKTPLGRYQERHRQNPQVKARHGEVLEQTTGLEDYLDVDKLRTAIDCPSASSARPLALAEGFITWLRSR